MGPRRHLFSVVHTPKIQNRPPPLRGCAVQLRTLLLSSQALLPLSHALSSSQTPHLLHISGIPHLVPLSLQALMAPSLPHGLPPPFLLLLLFLVLLLHHLPVTHQQDATPPPPPPPPPEDSCVGVFLSYTLESHERIHPFLTDSPSDQPYSFKSTATILNTDSVPFPSWSLRIGFPNRTVLVSTSSSILADGSSLPHALNSSTGISFSGFPNPDLKTAIETAGDTSQTQAQITITGTYFSSSDDTSPPPPPPISLDNPEFLCPPASKPEPSSDTTSIHTCCTRDPNFRPNSSLSDEELPRSPADLSITYDVLQSYDTSYIARVTIDNQSPLGRLDSWRLSWTWMQGEFIESMRGAHPTASDSSECIFGEQGQFYKDFDFSNIINCERSPTIVDLPLSMFNDSDVGGIPSCCRNGTILPDVMDPTATSSAFQLNVKKMPPHLNRTDLAPPQSFRISGSDSALNPTFNCSPPVRVTRSRFPDPGGLPTSTSAIATWQVVCNITHAANRRPRCCVSFSGFYNDSVVPCRTCACGCGDAPPACSTTTPAMLLPSESLLVPFENRTRKAIAWADIKHYNVPDPLPCGDFCGVSINWHVYTDYRDGWSARITIFNWETAAIADWFAAVVMDKAYDGFEDMYSFNGSTIGDDTIFMKGLPGLNYLVGENVEVDPKDPGKLQTVISFTKKRTRGIDVLAGDGFPSKVIFNGEECSLPAMFPRNHAWKGRSGIMVSVVTALLSVLLLVVGL